MADTHQNPVWTSVNPLQNQKESEEKSSFFWGNEAVFENLDKFERISNPNPEDQNFDFSFNDVVQNEDPSQLPSDAQDAVPQFEELDPEAAEDAGEQSLAPLEDVGLENIFQPETVPASSQEEDANPLQEDSSTSLEEISSAPEEPSDALTPEQSSPLDRTWERDLLLEDPLSETDSLQEEPAMDELEPTPSSETEQTPEFSEATTDLSEPQEEVPLQEEESSTELEAHLAMEAEPTSEISPLMEKYHSLLALGMSILKLQNKIEKTERSDFELLGNDTDKSMITYQISGNFGDEAPSDLKLTKKEKDFARDEETEHILMFSTQEKNKNLMIAVDWVSLYEEETDLQDPLKAAQVMEKINKFHFLFTEREQELSAQRDEIEAEKKRMKAFRNIFRNF